jgi:large subunit ribosomal protein L18
MLSKKEQRIKRAKKAKFKFKTSSRPRVVINRTAKHLSAQIVDDASGHTIHSGSTKSKDFADQSTGNVDSAIKLGKILGEKAVQSGVDKVVFDRNGYLYHGRVKAFADALREAGLEF